MPLRLAAWLWRSVLRDWTLSMREKARVYGGKEVLVGLSKIWKGGGREGTVKVWMGASTYVHDVLDLAQHGGDGLADQRHVGQEARLADEDVE